MVLFSFRVMNCFLLPGNACLPIRLDSRSVENNPEFIKLLSVLAENVGSNGTSVAVQRDFNEVCSEIKQ